MASESLYGYRHPITSLLMNLKGKAAKFSVFFLFVLLLCLFIASRWFDDEFISRYRTKTSNFVVATLPSPIPESTFKSFNDSPTPSPSLTVAKTQPKKEQRSASPYLHRLDCSTRNTTQFCSSSSSTPPTPFPESSKITCPEYFRWIHEDLKPWKETGITKEMVERARRTATFRLSIIDGRVYVERYSKSYQTRDVFTIWGILQLLRRYPGHIPDLELMFDCVDWPVIRMRDYIGKNVTPPPLFRYCGDGSHLDIVFPDWSFWGWAEVNIKPWDAILQDLKEGNKKIKWIDREPHAYWKGNPWVAEHRQDLLKCNLSETNDWNARIYIQDWIKESQHGYKQSNLADQCTHRYKIYIEGSAWSVSEKYILACDSPTLLITPKYHDFFTRSLVPFQHYWPIRMNDKCKSIKFAVDWGNRHKGKTQEIGKAASNLIQEDLKMSYVYDYMFHLLTEYGKLFKYKPTVPENATLYCSELMACPAMGFERKFLRESFVNRPTEVGPCSLPPSFDPFELSEFLRKQRGFKRQIERWEDRAWENQTPKM